VTVSSSAGFPAERRLRRRAEYRTVYDRGQRVPGRYVVLFVLEQDRGHPRLGITATRRVGSSVQRNRARRLVREAFRRHQHEMASWDIVVNVRSSASDCPFEEIERDLIRTLRRAERRKAEGRGSAR
jgi:ribonuclease P protein component